MTTNLNPIQALSAVQQVAVDRAIKLLEAAKAPYAIQMPDGSFIGELEVVVRQPRRKINDWMHEFPGYGEQIKAMNVGDVLHWELEEERCEAFRSTISSQCIHAHGKGSGSTVVIGNRVELMRVL